MPKTDWTTHLFPKDLAHAPLCPQLRPPDQLGRDGYRAEVVASPSGTPTARFVLPLSPGDQDGFIGQLLDAGNRSSATFTKSTVKTFGRNLFEAVFHGEILASFLRSRDRADADGAARVYVCA